MASIKIFCVTKNEYDLIEDFILYHGNLVGYNNIIIIDNASSNKNVFEIYEKYKLLGVKVHYENNYSGNGQADSFNKYMNMYKESCDYLIGLDTDEFLFSYDEFKKNNNPFNKEKILEVFNSYNKNDTLFKIDYYPCCVVDPTSINYTDNKMGNPARNIKYFSNDLYISEPDVMIDLYISEPDVMIKWNAIDKFFSKSNAFIGTTNGNHEIRVSYGKQASSKLGLLHFNDTGKRRFYERAKLVIDGYKYFSTDLDIKEQIDILNKIFFQHKANNYLFPGQHKLNSYYLIILRMYICELFIKYIKRLPSENELTFHSILKKKNIMFPNDIENEFKHCNECIENVNLEPKIYNENDKNDLIFYDESIDVKKEKYNVFENTFLQDLLLSIDK